MAGWFLDIAVAQAELMNAETLYGTRPDCLPQFIRDRTGEDVSRVQLLDFAESKKLAAVSINRFTPTFSAALDWEVSSSDERRWWDDESDWARLAQELLAPFMVDGARIAIFWGDLSIPTVTMPPDVAARHSVEILEAAPHFWFFPIGSSIVIECLMDGQVTVATIPSAD